MPTSRKMASFSLLSCCRLLVAILSSSCFILLSPRNQANALLCYNYSSTVNFLPPDAPVTAGCHSCTRGFFSGKWPNPDGQPDVFSWTCSNLAVSVPSVSLPPRTAVPRPDYPEEFEDDLPECAIGAYEIASKSAGYLALCSCCTDFCNAYVSCKTFPFSGRNIQQITHSQYNRLYNAATRPTPACSDFCCLRLLLTAVSSSLLLTAIYSGKI